MGFCLDRLVEVDIVQRSVQRRKQAGRSKSRTLPIFVRIEDEFEGRSIEAQGTSSSEGIFASQTVDNDEVFSPVVRYETVRFFLSKVACNDLEIYQADVKTAFQNSDLD